MTTAFDPFREIDRMFSMGTRMDRPDSKMMPMDLYRDGESFVVKMDLPGVSIDSIDIDVDDRTMTIRAERPAEKLDAENSQWLSRERTHGSFARQLTLGAGLDLAKIEADYVDGVLTLRIPVAEEAKPRKIEVRRGNREVGAGDDSREVIDQNE